jgi:hypothetical protein
MYGRMSKFFPPTALPAWEVTQEIWNAWLPACLPACLSADGYTKYLKAKNINEVLQSTPK